MEIVNTIKKNISSFIKFLLFLTSSGISITIILTSKNNNNEINIAFPVQPDPDKITTVPSTTIFSTTVTSAIVPGTTIFNTTELINTTTVPNTTVPNTTVPSTTISSTTELINTTTIPNTTISSTTELINTTTIPNTTIPSTTISSTTELINTTTIPNTTIPSTTVPSTTLNITTPEITYYDYEFNINENHPVYLYFGNDNVSFRIFGNRQVASIYITDNKTMSSISSYFITWNILDAAKFNYSHTISNLDNGKYFIIDDTIIFGSQLNEHICNIRKTSKIVLINNNSEVFQITDNQIFKSTIHTGKYILIKTINDFIRCAEINKYNILALGTDTGIYKKKHDNTIIKVWDSINPIKEIKWIEDNNGLEYWIIIDSRSELYFSDTLNDEGSIFKKVYFKNHFPGYYFLITACTANPTWDKTMICMGNYGFTLGKYYMFLFDFPLSNTTDTYTMYKAPDRMMEVQYIIRGNLIYTHKRFSYEKDFYSEDFDYNTFDNESSTISSSKESLSLSMHFNKIL